MVTTLRRPHHVNVCPQVVVGCVAVVVHADVNALALREHVAAGVHSDQQVVIISPARCRHVIRQSDCVARAEGIPVHTVGRVYTPVLHC
jgi:hypothetical protein